MEPRLFWSLWTIWIWQREREDEVVRCSARYLIIPMQLLYVFILPGKRRNEISLLFIQSGLLSTLAWLLRYLLLPLCRSHFLPVHQGLECMPGK